MPVPNLDFFAVITLAVLTLILGPPAMATEMVFKCGDPVTLDPGCNPFDDTELYDSSGKLGELLDSDDVMISGTRFQRSARSTGHTPMLGGLQHDLQLHSTVDNF